MKFLNVFVVFNFEKEKYMPQQRKIAQHNNDPYNEQNRK